MTIRILNDGPRGWLAAAGLAAWASAAVGACNLINGVDDFSVTGGAGGTTTTSTTSSGGVGAEGGTAGAPPAKAVWSRTFGSPTDDLVSGVVTTAGEEVMITGFTTGVAGFGGHQSPDAPGVFVATVDGSGEATGLFSYATGQPAIDASPAIVVGSDGRPVMAGVFGGQVDFGSGPVTALSPKLFVAALDITSQDPWTVTAGEQATFSGPHLAAGAEGTTYLFVDAKGGKLTLGAEMYTGTAKNAAYLAHLNDLGEVTWSRAFGSAEFVYAQAVAVDPLDGRSVYIAGKADAGPIDCGCNAPLVTQPYAMYVAKYDETGACIQQMSYGFNTAPHGLGVAPNGDLLLVGAHSNGFDVQGTSLAHAGGDFNFDAYVLRFDSMGTLLWARSYGAPGHDDDADEVAVGPDGDVYVVGHVSGTADIGDGVTLEAETTSDLYVLRFAGADGTPKWGARFANKTPLPVLFAHLAIDETGDLRVGGLFTGDIDFRDPESPHTAVGSLDAYLARLHPP